VVTPLTKRRFSGTVDALQGEAEPSMEATMTRKIDTAKLTTATSDFTQRFFDPNRAMLLDGKPVILVELSVSIYADNETLTRFPGSSPDDPALLIGYQRTTAREKPPVTIHLPRLHDGIPVIYAHMEDSALN